MHDEESLVFLDTETTGFNPNYHKIIEIFLLRVTRGGKTEEFHTLLNPEQPLKKEIQELTKLKEEDLKDAPKEGEVAARIREFLGTSTPCAHNLPFDYRFLQAMFKRQNCPLLLASGIDTLSLSRRIFPKLCVYVEGEGSHSLKNLMYHFGLETQYKNSHRAKEDVQLLVEIYQRLMQYARGEANYVFPLPVTHGCPLCGKAMTLLVREEKKLLCTKKECNHLLVL